MDRRKSIKLMGWGAFAGGMLLQACNAPDKEAIDEAKLPDSDFTIDRTPEEAARDKKLMEGNYFTESEMLDISLLADIIIPADEKSGSATDAGVPEFIDFIVQDMPQHQLPMRGGLKWLNMQCLKRFDQPFSKCFKEQQLEMVELIAWPDRVKDKPELMPGVAFFNLMRNLTASGFYTSETGIKDLEYIGNKPNKWQGVPDDVLKEHGLSYTEREMNESA